MVTIAVFAILLAVAVPSFRDAALRSNIRSVANELAASSYLARSEAIKRNAVVRLCASVTDTTTACDSTGASWSKGWFILAILPDATTQVIQRHGALTYGYSVIPSGGLMRLDYQSTGFGSTAATLKVCRSEPEPGREERVVTIEVSGKAYVAKTTTGTCS